MWWRFPAPGIATTSDRPGDAHAAARLAAVSRDLLVEVQPADARLLGLVPLGQQVTRDDPDHFELDAVGILGVQRLRRAVVGRSGQRARLGEPDGQILEVAQGVDLPR